LNLRETTGTRSSAKSYKRHAAAIISLPQA